MLKEIEDIEKMLRGPAAADPKLHNITNQVDDQNRRIAYPKNDQLNYDDMINVDGVVSPDFKEVFPFPDANRPRKSGAMTPAATLSKESVVGNVAPDYSGYDEMLEKLKGKKPRDTSTADLISMGVSTGIGALFGQTGAAAKVAGEYGLDRAAKADKKADSLEDMILKLELARAQQKAKGIKGTKVKSGAGSSNWRNQVRLGPDGRQYWMTNVDEQGNFVPTDSDIAFSGAAPKVQELKQPDGSTKQVVTGGVLHGTRPQGFQAADNKITEDAEGNKQFVNTRAKTVEEVGQGSKFNTTSLGTSKSDAVEYRQIEAKVEPATRTYRQTHQAATDGLTALAKADEAGAILALKRAVLALENGQRMSEGDFQFVKGTLGAGYANKIDSWLGKALDGHSLSDVEREQVRNLMVGLKNSATEANDRMLNMHNDMLRKRNMPENLHFKSYLGKYNPEIQRKKGVRDIHEQNQYVSDNYVLMRPEGSDTVYRVLPELTPEGKYKVIGVEK